MSFVLVNLVAPRDPLHMWGFPLISCFCYGTGREATSPQWNTLVKKKTGQGSYPFLLYSKFQNFNKKNIASSSMLTLTFQMCFIEKSNKGLQQWNTMQEKRKFGALNDRIPKVNPGKQYYSEIINSPKMSKTTQWQPL